MFVYYVMLSVSVVRQNSIPEYIVCLNLKVIHVGHPQSR